MLSAKLVGLAWRMQRVGKQQQTSRLFWLLGAEHACLPAAIGVPTEKNPARGQVFNGCNCVRQSRAIAVRLYRPGRTKGTVLTEGKVAAQHDEPRASKGFRKRN